MLVADIVVTAAAASAEVQAFRLDAIRRRLDDIDQFCFSEILFLAHDFRCDALAFDRERNEDRLALITRDTFAAKSNICDLEFDGGHRRTFVWTIGGVE